jgi:hypothetical protein
LNVSHRHLGVRVRSDFADRFAVAAKLDGRTVSSALRCAMQTFIDDVMRSSNEKRRPPVEKKGSGAATTDPPERRTELVEA